jgi:hypothetical protein
MLILTGFAVRYATTMVRGAPRERSRATVAPVGFALIPLLMLFALAGSATIDHYMPGPYGSAGEFALVAHLRQLRDGGCPPYGAGRGCGSGPPISPLPPVVPGSGPTRAPSR